MNFGKILSPSSKLKSPFEGNRCKNKYKLTSDHSNNLMVDGSKEKSVKIGDINEY